jgi:hypothetical protein
MWNIPSVKRHFSLALIGPWVVAGGLGIFAAEFAMAGDCGCEVACGCEPGCGFEEPACGMEASCGFEDPGCGFEVGCGIEEAACGFEPVCGMDTACGCEMSGCDGGCKPRRCNPIYRSLDAVAGGIEKLFGLDKCRQRGCGQCQSDCGCGVCGDSVMMEPAMMPVPSPPPMSFEPSHANHGHANRGHADHGHGLQGHAHVPPPVVFPSTPADSAPLPPSTRITPKISAPRLVPTPSDRSSGQHLGRPRSSAPLINPAPPSSSDRQSIESIAPTPVPDSAPDAFSDPFGDDEVHVRRFQPVKPSSYEVEVRSPSVSPVRNGSSAPRQRSLSTSERTSSRRSFNVR